MSGVSHKPHIFKLTGTPGFGAFPEPPPKYLPITGMSESVQAVRNRGISNNNMAVIILFFIFIIIYTLNKKSNTIVNLNQKLSKIVKGSDAS